MIGVLGGGLVGRRTSQLLASQGHQVRLVSRSPVSASSNSDSQHGGTIEYRIGDVGKLRDLDVIVLATESAHQVEAARALLRDGVTVVCSADRPRDVNALVKRGPDAEAVGAALVVGVAFSPGVSSLLVGHLASLFDTVDVITTARFGTGGPACAREHHRSMGASGPEIRSGALTNLRAGSGRRLVWFPEPAQAQDCYRAGLCEPALLQRAFPTVRRIQALQAATRRDRLTARLPMLRPPHPEGLVGATWAEVRGTTTSGAVQHRVMAATSPQATGAAAAAALVAETATAFPTAPGVHTILDFGPHDAQQMLARVAEYVTLWSYDGSAVAEEHGPKDLRAARKWQGPRNRFLTNGEIGVTTAYRAHLPKVLGFVAD